MGVQCTVFGHVYDGTEFEEHRKERPRGEVLICREYQVCRRCGNRTEMYRNERLLTPRPPEDEAPEPSESDRDPDRTLEGADGDGAGIREAREGGAETPAGTDGTSAEKPLADDPPSDSHPAEAAPAEDPPADDAIDTPDRTDNPSTDASVDRFSTDDSPDGDPPDSDSSIDDSAYTGPSVDGSPADDPSADDAVILSDGAADPDSPATGSNRGETRTSDTTKPAAPEADPDPEPLFDHDIDAGDVGCQACGRVWDRAVTSLRDGDICPECRRGYIERQ